MNIDMKRLKFILGICVLSLPFILIIGHYFYYPHYKLRKIKSKVLTIGTTLNVSTSGKSGPSLNYYYKVGNKLYFSSVRDLRGFDYPNGRYYVIYSRSDPKQNVIIKKYSVEMPLNCDTVPEEYLLDVIRDILNTYTEEEVDNDASLRERFEYYKILGKEKIERRPPQ